MVGATWEPEPLLVPTQRLAFAFGSLKPLLGCWHMGLREALGLGVAPFSTAAHDISLGRVS